MSGFFSPPSIVPTVEVVDFRDPGLLASSTLVNLGPNPNFSTASWSQLVARVPANYRPAAEKSEVFSALLPDVLQRLTLPASTARAVLDFSPGTLGRRGQFFDGARGFWHDGLVLAIRLLHGTADLASGQGTAGMSTFFSSCGFTAGALRSKLDGSNAPFGAKAVQANPVGCGNATAWLEYDTGSGFLTPRVVDAGPRDALAYLYTVRMCEGPAINVAIADYYFAWAWRLLGFSRTVQSATAAQRMFYPETYGQSPTRVRLMAMLCARAGLVEMVYVASVLLHELGHVFGPTPFHCQTVLGKPAQCCHWMSEAIYRNVAAAEFGLPLRLTSGNARTRFDFPANEGFTDEFRAPMEQCGKLPFDPPIFDASGEELFHAASLLLSQHCGFLNPAHQVDFVWRLGKECAKQGIVSGRGTYRGGCPSGGGGGLGKDPQFPEPPVEKVERL